ncbi:hypothetical protein [Nostoc sphaeroides]|uniref:hypothetical protein n=1 Tax=Nostoc sphaeroides TaxID=446679 RepID=UPI0018844F4F|nr:hypothetical protein [Nostoc sphaeroides]
MNSMLICDRLIEFSSKKFASNNLYNLLWSLKMMKGIKTNSLYAIIDKSSGTISAFCLG